MPSLPQGEMVILDKKLNKALIYSTPKSEKENFVYIKTVPFDEPFKTRTETLYCITPDYYYLLKFYSQDVISYVEKNCKR